MARFFIHRPVFAWVLAILISLLGIIAIKRLPVAQYPDIAPPTIAISATYSGASAETIQNTVTSVIEQQLTGIDNLLYIKSSSSDGSSSIQLTFEPGTDPDTAAVQVQNKVQLATPQLPQTVQQQGLSVTKRSGSFVLFAALSSADGSMDQYALGNYISSNVLDQVRRVPGVGEASLFGTEYAMRVWLDPQKMASYALMPGDITSAITAQNTNVSVGKLGDLPAPAGQQLNITLKGLSTLTKVGEFENILLRVNTDGSRVLLKDVARVELGAQNYTQISFVNGRPSAAIGIKLAPSANAMATVTAVRAKIAELQRFFPAGMQVTYPVDASKFIEISIEEVIKTLVEAIILVFLVIYLFLQNFRATFIPTIVVPVALLGTFGTMLAFGFSINVLTMFGLVLAIGILVDDAIVVVENVERIMSEEGLSPREATRKAMGQISGALIGITLVLTAVFIPMAFFTGSVGEIYRQFSLSLVASMVFSLFLAMTLTPALCASLLTPVEAGHKDDKRGFFGWFNRSFARLTASQQGWVSKLLRRSGRSLLVYGALCGAVGLIYLRLPASFLPDEDQGRMMTIIQLPSGATTERSVAVLREVQALYNQQPEIETTMGIVGFSSSGQGQNVAMCFTTLKDWSERKGAAHSVQAVINRLAPALARIKDAQVFPTNVPVIMGLGDASGFDLQLQDLGSLGHAKFMDAAHQLISLAAKDPRLRGVRLQGLEDEAQMSLITDEAKAAALGVSLSDVNTTLSTAFGSSYVNNFVNGNRIQRAALLPTINAGASSSRSRTPADVAGSSAPVISGQYGVSVGAASWELDLFGRVRSLKDKALETYLAADETRRAAALSLIASVASQYLTKQAYAEQLELARQTLASVSHSRDLTQRSFELGGSSELDLQSAQSEVLTAQANVAKYQRELAAATHALELLVGASLPADLPAPAALASLNFPQGLRAGLPSDLLQNRPDILAAEHTLKAANANIGAARAAFFPKIALTGSTGTASTELSGLFKAGSETWSFAPQITLPLFTAGSNKASLDYAQLAKQAEIAKYEAVIQTAFKEVADTLSAQVPLDQELATYEALVKTQQKRLQLAEARHRNGAASYLEVLTAQESLYSAQQSLISTQLTRLQNLVTFYEVLGGGTHSNPTPKG